MVIKSPVAPATVSRPKNQQMESNPQPQEAARQETEPEHVQRDFPPEIVTGALLPGSVVVAATALLGMDKAVPALAATAGVAALLGGATTFFDSRKQGDSVGRAVGYAAFSSGMCGLFGFVLGAVAAPEHGGFPMLPFRPDQLSTAGTVAAVAAPILLAAATFGPHRHKTNLKFADSQNRSGVSN